MSERLDELKRRLKTVEDLSQTKLEPKMPDEIYINEPTEEHTGDLLYEGRASRFHARHRYIRYDIPPPAEIVQAMADALEKAIPFIDWLPSDPSSILKPMEDALSAFNTWKSTKGGA